MIWSSRDGKAGSFSFAPESPVSIVSPLKNIAVRIFCAAPWICRHGACEHRRFGRRFDSLDEIITPEAPPINSSSISFPRDVLLLSISSFPEFSTLELGDTLGYASECSLTRNFLLNTMTAASSLASEETFLFPGHPKRHVRFVIAGSGSRALTWSSGTLQPIQQIMSILSCECSDVPLYMISFKRTPSSFVCSTSSIRWQARPSGYRTSAINQLSYHKYTWPSF